MLTLVSTSKVSRSSSVVHVPYLLRRHMLSKPRCWIACPNEGLLDILAIVNFWTQWTRHFGPLSGSESKLADPVQRYILTAFTFGCNLGPAQAARHLQGLATAHELSFTNRRHVSVDQLDAVIKDLINAYHRCDLPKVWGQRQFGFGRWNQIRPGREQPPG